VSDKLAFGSLEPLVTLMQETPPDMLMPQLVDRLRSGTSLKTLVAAGALANARSFGGQDYIGFHTFMALAPAYAMSAELPEADRPLPVLKVLYRNTARIQAEGGCEHEKLHAIEEGHGTPDPADGESLRDLIHQEKTREAESALAGMTSRSIGEAYQHLQYTVQEEIDVHRIVLSWRAWETLDLVGKEHATTLLRQSVRFCVGAEKHLHEEQKKNNVHPYVQASLAIRTLLPKLFDQYKLLEKPLGTRAADDAWIEKFAKLVYGTSREQAADAAAAALAEGISPESVGEALSLAANMLLLHDPGRTPNQVHPGKPVGSVHGDSVGVHASDAANAWRNIARVSNQRNTAASMVVGAFHTAGQSGRCNKEPYPTAEQLDKITSGDPAAILRELDAAIRAKDQFQACALTTRYGQTGGQPRAVFDMLLRFATSEDGALHAEKYYRTVTEEFALSRPAYRWRQLAALARVSASEFGTTAAGYQQARALLKS
jgi:hypothetical protein